MIKIYSGLGVNNDKTELMPLGIAKNSSTLKSLGCKIVSEMKVTGAVFTYDEAVFRNKNFSVPLSKIEKSFNMWKQRNLSIIGKVQIIKTYGASQLLFITNMLSVPPNVLKVDLKCCTSKVLLKPQK